MRSTSTRRATRLRIFGAALSLAATPVDAQTAGDRPAKITALDPIVVTAARGPQPFTELLADMTVIERDTIARAGVESLVELLQRQPGIEIIQNGGPGATSGVFLRGTNTAQTLVLIDGVRVSSSTTGTTALEAIPLEQIERIEILRGPASSLYGSDAIGGVIQVFTRRGSGAISVNGAVGYGTYKTWALAGGTSGSAGPLAFAVHLGGKRSDGFNAIVNPTNFSYDPDPDGYENESIGASGTLTFAPDQTLSARYFRNRLNNQFDAGDAFDDRTITTLETWQVDSRNRLAAFWVSRLSAAEGTDDSVSETGFGNFPFRTRQLQYTWLNDFTLPAGLLTIALERREERVDTDPPYAVTSRNTTSVTAIYQWRHEAHALQANVRHDDSSQYGGKTTGALAYGYRLSPEWRFIAGGGTAFKAPSFNDLYFPGFSNPFLQPETSRSFEAGAYWTRTFEIGGRSVGIDASAVAWRNQVRNLIVFQCDADFNCLPQNVDDATLTGVTFTAEARIAATTTLSGSLDLQSPENDTNGKQLPRRARQHGALAVTQQAGPVRLGLELIASSYRYDDAENLRRLAGYTSVNLTAEWPFAKGWTLYVRGDNVFDNPYQLAADYSNGGTRVFAGVRGRL
jgi:vitamin B12 transporter